MVIANPSLPALAAITDVAVCAHAPHHILVATQQGHVHLFADAQTPTGVFWSCHGGVLRVGWAGTRALAWNSDSTSHQLWVLGADGQILRQHTIPAPADLAPYDDGFFIATGAVRLAHYELANDGTYSRDQRYVPAPGAYEPGSLTTSSLGAVALRSGGQLQLQTSASRAWQDIKVGGVVSALSASGKRLATAFFHEDGSHVHSLSVHDSEVALETSYAVRALPTAVTSLEWSIDETMLLVHARLEGDVRVFFRDGWVPGLWTSSVLPPRFHPTGVITIPTTRDRLLLNSPRGATPRTWSRARATTPATFEISGNAAMRRGDKVLVFEKRPRTRPTSIYEVVAAHRKDDDIRGLPDLPVMCRIRLGLSPIADSLLDADALTLASITDNDGGEIDLVSTRALLERLLSDQPTELEQMRMNLATSEQVDASPQPALLVTTPSTGETLTVEEAPAVVEAPTVAEPPEIEESDSPIARADMPILDEVVGGGAGAHSDTARVADNVGSEAPEAAANERATDPTKHVLEAAAIRRKLLEELYETYMESSSAYRNYDGRDPGAVARAREAEWLKARGYLKGTIGGDHWMTLQMTPDGREHFEGTAAEKPEVFRAALTKGEDPSVLGGFRPEPPPEILTSTETLHDVVGEGVDVLLVTAVSVERDAMLCHMTAVDGRNDVLRVAVGDLVYFVGRLGHALAALVMTRTGATMRDGATLAVNEAIGACKPRAVIAVGMAWGMNTQQLRLGDVLVSTQIVPFDIARRQDAGDVYRGAKPEAGGLLLNRFRNVTGWNFARTDGYVCRIKDGPVLCGESLVDSLAYKAELHSAFPDAIGGEMEGTGIYGASAKHRGEWIIVKAVCDWADGTKDKRAQPLAAAVAASLVAHVVAERGTLASLPRMGAATRAGGAVLQGAPSIEHAGRPDTDRWRVEKRDTKRAEVAGEALVASLAFLDGLSAVISTLVTTRRDVVDDGDPRGRAAWQAEVESRWGQFAPISHRFIDAQRLAEAYLSDEVGELLKRVWLVRASIKAAHATYFSTPEAVEFFKEGFGSAPEKELTALRDECRRLLRPIAQLA